LENCFGGIKTNTGKIQFNGRITPVFSTKLVLGKNDGSVSPGRVSSTSSPYHYWVLVKFSEKQIYFIVISSSLATVLASEVNGDDTKTKQPPNGRRYRQARELVNKTTRCRIRRWGRFPESVGECPHLSGARSVGCVLIMKVPLILF
jgi:hypothetical protein